MIGKFDHVAASIRTHLNGVWYMVGGKHVWQWQNTRHLVGICAELAHEALNVHRDLSILDNALAYAYGRIDGLADDVPDYEWLGSLLREQFDCIATCVNAVANDQDDDGSIAHSVDIAMRNAYAAGVRSERICYILAKWIVRDLGLLTADDDRVTALGVALLRRDPTLVRELLKSANEVVFRD